MNIFDIVGWAGMILVLLAYILLSTNKLKNGVTYQLLNLLAAVLMAIGLYPKDAWFSFTLQVIWGVVAIIAILKMQKKPQKAKAKKK